uniref:Uncharacterized protein n=1 Tax=Lepeophtheirus salmonis TaxID=72036 RepID=A0A0K2THC1_LEPSM
MMMFACRDHIYKKSGTAVCNISHFFQRKHETFIFFSFDYYETVQDQDAVMIVYLALNIPVIETTELQMFLCYML